jgi:DNA-binding NarL/FixJ family response regulator
MSVQTLILLALGCAVLILCGVSLALFRMQRSARRHLQVAGARIDELTRTLDALLTCSRGFADRLRAQERCSDELRRHQEQLETSSGASPTATKVLQLLQKGYTVEDIATICDLSLSEVDLINSIARYRRVA